MPEICRFFGIRILMFYNDHAPPHFHAEYGGGRIQRRALGMVVEWARGHQRELEEDWERARRGQPLLGIRPLE